MTTEYGMRISGALKAIVQLHSDTSRLLVDCDKHLGKGRPSVFGSYATRDLTYHYKAEFWMAEGVYRYYPAGPNAVDGITVAFHYAGAPSVDPETEPLLLIARIQYSSLPDTTPPGSAPVKGRCEEWDVWNLYFVWGRNRQFGKVLEYESVDNGRISWARLIAVPLYTVDSIELVVRLADEVGAASPERSSATRATE